jgi:hypothetical protein
MRTLAAVVSALALVACKKPEAPASAQAEAPAAPAAQAGGALKGKVLERQDAPPYSYLRLATASGEVWAAVPQTDTAVGVEAAIASPFPMKDFESKTLNRKFDVVYFGTLAGAPGQAAAPAPAPGPAAPGGGAMGGPTPPESPAQMAAQHRAAAEGPEDVKVAKIARAPGPDGKTVEELFGQRTALREKKVTVKGQVVKFSPGIMGRNWIHLRDGTGSKEKKNDDVTVTTQDDVKVGDVVTVKGTVRLDKDFGAGYAYPVILEDAKVSQK